MTPKLLGRILVVLAALAVAGLVAAFVPVDGHGPAGNVPAGAASAR